MSTKLNYGSILIVTYGRSGSTLLQGVLNSIDGCLIRGENNNLCYSMFQAYKRLVCTKIQKGTEATEHPWYGASELNEDAFLERLGSVIKDQLVNQRANITCYGFKEIRYTPIDLKNDFSSYLDFLAKLFPNPLFIFNKRDMNHVVKSGWWKDIRKSKVIDLLQKTEEQFDSYAKVNTNTFTICYEDVVSKNENLKRLFDKIGAHYSEEIISTVLDIPHSYRAPNPSSELETFTFNAIIGGNNSKGAYFLKKEKNYRRNQHNDGFAKLASRHMIRRALLHSPLSKEAMLIYLKYYSSISRYFSNRHENTAVQ